VDPGPFWDHWEERNIAHYREPYRPYKEICRISLEETFRHFRVPDGDGRLIQRYFDAFPRFTLYPDVAPTLEALAPRHRLAVVSNIDDDLLAATPLGREFDLVHRREGARAGREPLPPSHRASRRRPEDSPFRAIAVHGWRARCLTARINRRGLRLHPSVPRPDFTFSGLALLGKLLLA
jgi:2-haloacid dehalogenase